MTCKDCIYSPLCKVYADFGVTDVPYDKNDTCEMFKSKSDFVEVVRCVECKYVDTVTCPITGTKIFCCDYDVRPFKAEPTHFCGYGERK